MMGPQLTDRLDPRLPPAKEIHRLTGPSDHFPTLCSTFVPLCTHLEECKPCLLSLGGTPARRVPFQQRIPNAGTQSHCDAEQVQGILGCCSWNEEVSPQRPGDVLDLSGDTGRERRVDGSGEEDQVVEQASQQG